MKSLSIDIETYSDLNLAKTGVYRYVESPMFEILLFAYSVDGGPVQQTDLARGEKIPSEILSALTDDSVTKWAFNANFERVCLSRFLGLPTGEYLTPDSWKCSMVWAATMGLPLSLEGVGAVLGLEKQKLTEGKDLIKYFCQPCVPKKANGQRTRNLSTHDPDKWSTFKKYNIRDVETEMSIQARLSRYPVPDSVWDEYHIDQEINDRGVALDMELVRQAIQMDGRSRVELTQAMQKLTSLDNPNSVQQMKQWLSDNGMETETLGKKAVAELLKTAPPELQSVLTLRQQLAKSSVKKYQTMENCVCSDNRARGMFQFYGANRTGRWAGRIIQMQNLPQNHLDDLAEARSLVRCGDYDAVKILYEDVPDTLSQLIRTAFVPQGDRKFIVSDFSAIEARVIAWLAGETWRRQVFADGKDIYCASASQMFGVPVEKHGINGHLRQKGKQAELACIAEGSLVLTDRGLVPIEKVTTEMKVWDGKEWVAHDGVVYRGQREVITYEGLTATPDHLVWVEGQSRPIQFGLAAAGGAHLVQTGDGGRAIRLGEDNQSGEALECELESLLCSDAVPRVQIDSMADAGKSEDRKIQRLSKLYTAKANSGLAGKTSHCGKTKMRKPKRCGISQLWCQRHQVRILECNGGRTLSNPEIWNPEQKNGAGPNRYEWKLCSRKHSLCGTQNKLCKPAKKCIKQIRAAVLALLPWRSCEKAVSRAYTGRDNSGGRDGGIREKEELAANRRTARLYDIRNAGRHHRFTVSGHLVHNCGYGGGVGALKAMGALEMGLTEDELQPLVASWRQANPKIVQFWWAVDSAVTDAVTRKTTTKTHGLVFSCRNGMLFITLPSGRNLAYVKPRIGENKFGGTCITYEGIGATKKWERLDSYGPKFVENIVQGIARDILCYAMKTLRCCNIVMHIHDELVIEVDRSVSLQTICEQMSRTPPWAEGLQLRADGYECDFYKKD